MHKRIIIVGHGGSGKDYMAQKFVDRNFKMTLSTTTRPIRLGEIAGVTYDYIDNDKFMEMVGRDMFYQWKSFTVEGELWCYGTTYESWNKDEIFILTTAGVADITPEDRKNCFIIFIDIPEEIRRERLSKRNDADSVERRMEADRKDFLNYTDFDIRITNHLF